MQGLPDAIRLVEKVVAGVPFNNFNLALVDRQTSRS